MENKKGMKAIALPVYMLGVTLANTKLINALITLTIVVGITACATEPKQSANNPIPQTNTQASQKSVVNRVVTLIPLPADLVYTLDRTKLVGVSSDRYIEASEKFNNLPRVGKRAAINLEQVVALKPDLVIGSSVFQGKMLEQLQRLGISTMPVKVDSWEDLEMLTTQIAEKFAADPQPILQQYQTFVANPPQHNKTVLVLSGVQPSLSPNKKSWAGDLVAKFGYKNLVADLPSSGNFQGYLNISSEKILDMNPDQIFLIEGIAARKSPDEIKSLPFWKNLKAVQTNQVFVFHYDKLIAPKSINTVKEVTLKLRETAAK